VEQISNIGNDVTTTFKMAVAAILDFRKIDAVSLLFDQSSPNL
jgi:hypothetical protein